MKEIELTEKYISQTVINAEKLANETYLASLDSEMFAIKEEAIDDEDHKKMISNYFSDQISQYRDTKNIYKESCKEFRYLNSLAKNSIGDESRLNLISQFFIATLKNVNDTLKEDNPIELAKDLDVINQLRNLHNIVYDTHLLKLKSEYCKEKIAQIKQEVKVPEEHNSESNRPLTLKHVALLLRYSEVDVNTKNRDKIAAKYGFTKKEMGRKLYQEYNYFDRTNRSKYPGTKIKLKHQIKRIERVLDILPENKKHKAEQELKSLKSHIDWV